MKEQIVVNINTILYIALFIYCFIRHKWHNISTILSLLYAISSIASFLLYIFPLYDITATSYGTATLAACLYQFVINFLLIMAFEKCNIYKYSILSGYSERCIYTLIKILVIFLGTYILFSLPISAAYFFSGKELSDLRDATYSMDNRIKLPFVVSLISRVFGSLPIFLISAIAIRVFLLRIFTTWDKYGVYVYALYKIDIMLGFISRATIIFSLLEVFILVCLFYQFLSLKMKKNLIKYIMIIAPAMFLVFTAISTSRFSSGTSNDLNAELSDLRYAGESQLNFMNLAYPDLKEPFCGYSQLALYRRVLGLDYSDGNDREEGDVYNTYIQKYFHYPHPTFIFYGLSGTLYMNWGSWGTILIASLLFLCIRRQYNSTRHVSFMNIILTVILASYVGKGIFYADFQNESGNLMILYMIILVFYLKRNGINIKIVKNEE